MKTWGDIFSENQKLLTRIKSKIKKQEKKGKTVLLLMWHEVYRAFHFAPLSEIKVVILGQDPYPKLGDAMGLAFSVKRGYNLPKSLKNIYKEIERDIRVENNHGSLIGWARQGVLLLNTCLTVEKGKPGSHFNIGWDKFTDNIIKEVSNKGDVVFMLWGRKAQKKETLINHSTNLVLKAAHPSPLSANRGFFGCGHFSKANEYLKSKNLKEIAWGT